jgi:hypothetical protein
MIYLLIFIYLLILSFAYEIGNLKKGKNFNKFFLFLILVGLAGFRYRVGGDTYFYMLYYDYLPNLSQIFSIDLGITKFQPLWLLLNAFSRSISPEFYVFQILHATIINSIIFYFFNKNTRYFFTAILMYYLGFYGYFNFEILRESLAICIFLLSINYFVERKWAKYYLLSVVAFGFHFSAIILFVLPFLKRIPITFPAITIIVILGILLNSIFLNFINSLSISNGLLLSLDAYREYKYTLWGLLSIVLLWIIYPIIILKISTNLNIKNNLHTFLQFYILIGSFSLLFFIFFRFRNYFIPFLFLFLAEILHKLFRLKSFKDFRIPVLLIVFSFFTFIHTYSYFTDTSDLVPKSKWYSRWYPYNSIFDKRTDQTRERLFQEL